MSDDAGLGLVERARDASAQGDWRQAFDLLMEADVDDLLVPTDLPLLGEVAYAAGHLDVTIEAWDRAHADCMQAGDHVAAAGAAVPRGDARAVRSTPAGPRRPRRRSSARWGALRRRSSATCSRSRQRSWWAGP